MTTRPTRTLACALLLLGPMGAVAQGQFGNYHSYNGEMLVWLTPGVSNSKLDWNIADTDGDPNVLSELVYDDLETYTLELGARIHIQSGPLDNVVLEASGLLGWIQDGRGRDRDWNGNDRSALFSDSTSEIDHKRISRASAAIGYQFQLLPRFALTPMLGYDRRDQRIETTQGVQLVPATGPIAGLRSDYETTWDSPWVGLEATLTPFANHALDLRGEYHQPDFDAKATWNLRADLAQPDSFSQSARDGEGYRLRLRYRWEFIPRWQLTLAGDWEQFSMNEGIDRINLILPRVETLASRLNEVNWEQVGYSAGITWRF